MIKLLFSQHHDNSTMYGLLKPTSQHSELCYLTSSYQRKTVLVAKRNEVQTNKWQEINKTGVKLSINSQLGIFLKKIGNNA
jgi:hypothetical protein